MIGIDTNVIVRLLVADDEKQTDAASRYLKQHCSSDDPALLSDIVLVECAWVLEDVYEYSRAQIGDAIDGLLATAQLRASVRPRWCGYSTRSVGRLPTACWA
jgi:predicted nucleic-acid-binding protein